MVFGNFGKLKFGGCNLVSVFCAVHLAIAVAFIELRPMLQQCSVSCNFDTNTENTEISKIIGRTVHRKKKPYQLRINSYSINMNLLS